MKVITRKVVSLDDPEYFCNKSWTLSYNMNTKSWISFHSYIPNWYIAENNFFYSGINGCCDDFEVIVGELVSESTTTTTTTITCVLEVIILEEFPPITTTTTTLTPVITTTTTTSYQCRPQGLIPLFLGYTIYDVDLQTETTFAYTFNEARDAILLNCLDEGRYQIGGNYGEVLSIEVGQVVYRYNECTTYPSGYFVTDYYYPLLAIVHINSGTIIDITPISCPTTTTTTTTNSSTTTTTTTTLSITTTTTTTLGDNYISFPPLDDVTYSISPYDISDIASTVPDYHVVTYASSNPDVATIEIYDTIYTMITITGVGETTITASSPGYADAYQTLTVISRVISVDGVGAEDKIYDGYTNATLITGGEILVGIETVDEPYVTLSGTPIGNFISPEISEEVQVEVDIYGYTLSGTRAFCYTIYEPVTAYAYILAP